MDIKLKKYSHSIITKIIVFVIAVIVLTLATRAVVEVEIKNDGDFSSVSDENYYESKAFIQENENLIRSLTRLLGEYKNEEYIISGKTISQEEWRSAEDVLYEEFQYQSRSYNPELSEEKNFNIFKTEYAEELSREKDRMIKEDLKEFHLLLQNIEKSKLVFYASDGKNVFANSQRTKNEQFETFPSYMMFEEYQRKLYPKEVEDNEHLHWITEQMDELDPENMEIYTAFTPELLDSNITKWQHNKEVATKNLYRFLGYFAVFILLFAYLMLTAGRTSFHDQKLHFHPIDKLYNDINIILCILLLPLWVVLVDEVFGNIDIMTTLTTISFSSLGLVLIMSLVKHCKNRTLIKHTLIFTLIYKLVRFIGDVFRSGSPAVKTVLIVIGYPIAIAATFFIFPVTIGIAAWFAFKKIKSFQAIQEGVEIIKDGNLQHRIDLGGKGEFGKLSANINTITEGLNKAVDNELKSERLKSELITNVSHDIRTPLTSIISYVDLLKGEKDSSKVEKYIEVLDQKSKRLKLLTDDLFEATKASSGNIPVHLEKIDIVSLVTQGLGEVNDKIEASELDFKLNYPKEKVYVTADGKLLWRSIENLLSNIFKYALKGSRVYVSFEDSDTDICLTLKNISAYELNISADELMERFKRGDESRTSQGSGLGLSIAKSLIEMQKGKFSIQVDGDLFKAIICLPKFRSE